MTEIIDMLKKILCTQIFKKSKGEHIITFMCYMVN